MTMDKKYDPETVEKKWQKKWKDWGVFKFDPNKEGENFSIDTPPPTASGSLHMGHAKNYLEFEIISRAMRLLGYNVFFPVGYDDNGLPTEKYVEEEEGVKREDVGKEKFIERCERAADDLESNMTRLFKRIGMSWDWSTLYKTMDSDSIETAQRSFIDLFDKNQVYRKKDPILWCPYHETSLAQATVEDKDRNTKLNYLYFEKEDGDRLEIATTRPELLPSCVAVFVHPDDEQYRDLVGKKVKVPLFGHEVPVLESEEVDQDFGSGVVMVCTFGDSSDVELWKKNDLPMKISITSDGRMNENAGKYEGMKVEEAKDAIIDDLKDREIIFDQEDIEQTVGVCWRCETPIEFIPTEQWFVKVLDHREKMIDLGSRINWFPDYYRNRYEDWVKNLKWDWCISRQRYYGVPFPVWFCGECGKPVVADEDDLPIDPRYDECEYTCPDCGSDDLVPDDDVMDTWMTSSLTPQITGGWKREGSLFEQVYPMTLRPQSHDIIRTWAFYTILKSYLHEDSIPWRDVMISGYVYAKKGIGMSKSKGTGVSPENVIEENGADCLRYWAAGTKTGEDIIYEEKKVTRGRKILTKLWNASRFVEMHLDGYKDENAELEKIDLWLLTKLDSVLDECEEHYKNYETSKVRRKMESFFMEIFCDNYLEMVKHRLYNPDEYGKESKQAALVTLYRALLACIKVFMPIVPHLTEEIYSHLFAEREKTKSINMTDWPVVGDSTVDEEAENLGDIAKDIVEEIRRWKSEEGISLNTDLKSVEISCDQDKIENIKTVEDVIRGTMNVENIVYNESSGSDGTKVENHSVWIDDIKIA